MKAIEISSVTKRFKDKTALSEVTMSVEEGEIFGLVGPNGSGKTTLLRAILGLCSVEGEISLFGSGSERELIVARRNIGALVETPSLKPTFCAVDNMKALAYSLGERDEQKLKDLLEKVGLDANSKKPARNFSLGMRERLAIAMSLIGSPKILILDEPINGLDPNGISKMRELLLRLKSEGVTIVISSHIISELQKVADAYGVLKDGKLVCELHGDDLKSLVRPYVKLVVADMPLAKQIAENNRLEHQILPNGVLKIYEQNDVTALVSIFKDAGVMSASIDSGDIENYILERIGG